MACNCGGGAKKKTLSYLVQLPDGNQRVYSTEIEAKAAIARAGGGTMKAQTAT